MRKRIFLSFVLLLVASSFAFSQSKEKKAKIQLDSTQASIGTFPKSNSLKTTVFTFKNVGNDKLVFYGAATNCGCVTVSYPDKPIKPGKKGKITVTFDGKHKTPAKFSHKINFSCNGSPAYFTLRVNGVMTKN